MDVTLLASTPFPFVVAADAASICTNSGNRASALHHALSSGHDSVLEHVSFTFRIRGVSRSLLAQLTRHRIASYSVQSQRYVSYKDQFDYVVPPSIKALGAKAEDTYCAQMEQMHSWYCEWCELLGQDKKEDARFVLPNATSTELIMTMNARELKHFFSLRCCNRAQWEIRELADRMLEIVKNEEESFFKDAGPGCVRGKCPEKNPCGHPKGGNQNE